MRRAGALAVGGGPRPARGGAESVGSTFRISLSDFPARIRRRGAFSGVLTLVVGGQGVGGPKAARVETYVRTHLGRAVTSDRTCDVRPGELRVSRMTYSLDDDALPGTFTFGVRVTIGGETLEAEHEVEVCPDP